MRGDYEAARSMVGESRAIFEALGDRRGVAKTLGVMGDVDLDQGEHEAAHALYEEALAILDDLDDRWWMAWCLEGLAGAAAAQGQPVRAALVFGAAEVLREEIKAPPPWHTGPTTNAGLPPRSTRRSGICDGMGRGTGNDAGAGPRGRSGSARTQASYLPAGLTAREAEVLRLVARSMSNAEVGGELFISPRTIDAHLTSIYAKLGISSRTAATRFAIEHDLV
jgi:DNA-binding CsgD family transcriptional regulator